MNMEFVYEWRQNEKKIEEFKCQRYKVAWRDSRCSREWVVYLKWMLLIVPAVIVNDNTSVTNSQRFHGNYRPKHMITFFHKKTKWQIARVICFSFTYNILRAPWHNTKKVGLFIPFFLFFSSLEMYVIDLVTHCLSSRIQILSYENRWTGFVNRTFCE